jgi:long-subunit fatty acid transport protein
LRLIAASAMLVAAHVSAAENYASPIDDRFRLTAGAFFDTTGTTIRLDGAIPDSGTLINAEDDLGLSEKNTLADVEIMIGMRERHHVRLNYFKLNRAAAQPLERLLVIRGDTYNVGDFVESSLDVRMLSLTYSYSFLHNPHVDIAGSFGLNVLEFHARALVRARALDQSQDDAGAFPTLGIDVTVPLSSRFYVEARADYLKVNIHDFEGSADSLHAGVLYRWRENLAFGVGYFRFNIDLTSNNPGDTGTFALDNSGTQAFLRMSF